MVHYTDGLIITGGHPTMTTKTTTHHAGEPKQVRSWTLPRHHSKPELTACAYIYNLQIRGSVAFRVQNTMCLALGS
eukprot:1944810-Heterocapsa_arctica.AAC.1